MKRQTKLPPAFKFPAHWADNHANQRQAKPAAKCFSAASIFALRERWTPCLYSIRGPAMTNTAHSLAAVLLAAMALHSSGCAMKMLNADPEANKRSTPLGENPAAAPGQDVIGVAYRTPGEYQYQRYAAPAAPPTITIEFHPASGKVKAQQVPLAPGMSAQDAIDQTKAGKHFHRSKLDLVRKSELAGDLHKMPLAWDNGKRRVAHSTNYDLHAGDRLMIREDTSNALDDLLAKLTGDRPKR
jgi:hypothetical protein